MKRLFTSYYARSGKNPNAVSISAKAPSFYTGKVYLPLAPSWELLRAYKSGQVDEWGYTEWYLRLLTERKLTPEHVVGELEEGSVLLCYEKSKDFCHRHIVAEWLEQSGVARVTELTFSAKGKEESTQHPVDEFLEF